MKARVDAVNPSTLVTALSKAELLAGVAALHRMFYAQGTIICRCQARMHAYDAYASCHTYSTKGYKLNGVLVERSCRSLIVLPCPEEDNLQIVFKAMTGPTCCVSRLTHV